MLGLSCLCGVVLPLIILLSLRAAACCKPMAGDQAVPVMVEVKTVKAFTPSTFIAEVEAQIINAAAEFGFAIVKKRGTADVGKYYALTNVDQMMSLIERVYHPSTPQQAVLCNVYDEYGQCDLTRSHAGNHRDAHEPRAFRPEPKRFTRV